MKLKFSFRGWLTIITVVLLTIVVFVAWPEIMKAWALLDQVNLWILALLIPVQFFSYYATGGMIFSYLRAKGNLKNMSHAKMTRTALELNFVNHVLPSGGAAGFSYLAWILSYEGVSVARSTMSQIVRFALTFLSFVVLLAAAVVVLTINHQIDRTTVIICAALAVACIGALIGAIWLIKNKKRLDHFAVWLTRTANKVISFFTRGKKKDLVKGEVIEKFFDDIRDDYVEIRRDRRVLVVPFIWALLANMADVALIWIAFWALGFPVDPAIIFVAFGLASVASAISVTPGGAGVYETIMITFLAASAVPANVAIAGTLLARVTLVVGTIAFGYVFYQMTVLKHGKRPA